ncbi:MAG: hypothetical protein AUJ51_12515 [Elusimicrobia bacterium CG1_02_56_21]|nr:MAG: hypothetical protein AUJ51_12515 [Elusimicrobia bacterium CG1_02_56_21]
MLTDARIKAVLGAIGASGPGLGELSADPGAAPAFFRPLKARLQAASAAPPSSPASSQALSAAGEFTGRLEKFFSDLALHGTAPDKAVEEALLRLQGACGEAPALLSPGGRAGASARIRGLAAGAHKTLALARAAAEAAPDNFPQNLKFSSIYTGLDGAFDAYESCAEALFKL